MAVRPVPEPETDDVDQAAFMDQLFAEVDRRVDLRVRQESVRRVEHVSLFPTKHAVAAFTSIGYLLGPRVLLLLASCASFYLTMTGASWPSLIVFNGFIVLPSAALAFAGLQQNRLQP